MTTLLRCALAALSLAAAAQAGATCYTVYVPGNRVVYRSPDVPVDMRYPLHDTVPRRFGPGATMVFTLRNEYCDLVGVASGTTGPTSVYPPSIYREPVVNAASIMAPASATTPTVSAPIRRAAAVGGMAQ